jgi:hypothetical protein
MNAGGAGGRYFKMKQGARVRLGPSWGVKAGGPPRTLAIRSRFNSGPTPRDAILDLMRLLDEEPDVWRLMER